MQLLEDENEIAILRSVSLQLTEIKKEAENAEFWLGYSTKDELVKARHIMEQFDMLSDLCVKKTERVYDFTNFKVLDKSIAKNEIGKLSDRRKSYISGVNLETEMMDNVSDMMDEWNDDDIRVTQETEENDA